MRLLQTYVVYCRFCPSRSELIERIVHSTARVPLIVSDVLVLGITWVKMWRNWKDATRLDASISLATCLLRNGESATWQCCTDFSP